jgi:hypothetical protein
MLKKRLRVIVPTLQVLLLISATLWLGIISKVYINQPEVIVGCAQLPIQILMKLNLPLSVLWFPVFYAMHCASASSSNYGNLPSGATGMLIIAVINLAILSSVALFWYFVVVEIEKRRYGSSLIRLSNRTLEIVKAIVLMAAGMGAIAVACWEVHRLFLLDQLYRHAIYWSSMVNAILGGLFLLTWASVLITVSVKDLKLVLRRNQKSPS